MQKDILEQQIQMPTPKVGYFMIYSYAQGWDWFFLILGGLCAIGGGAALPLFTVFFGNITSTFRDVASYTLPYDDFYDILTKNVLYFIYLGIAEFLTIGFATFSFVHTGNTITQRIRVRYLRAILTQNIAFFDSLGAGEITTRISGDMALIQDGVSEKASLVLTGVASFVTAFVIAFVKYWRLAAIATSTLGALLGIMGVGSTVSVIYSKRAIECYGRSGSVADNVLESIRTVVAFGAQEGLARKYEGHLRGAEKYGRVVAMTFAVVIGGILGIMYLNYGLGLWMGSRFLVQDPDNVEPGDILTIMMAIILGSYALGNVAPNLQAFSDAVAAATKVLGTIERESPLNPLSGEGKRLGDVVGGIELRNIRHAYPSRPEVVVMDRFNLSIPAGKTTAFVGPSGSGKSTIIGLLERYYNPIAGSVLLDGHDIETLNLQWLRQQISLVGQEPQLFTATIFENIKYGLIGSEYEKEDEGQIRARIYQAARIADAHDFITALPDGYETNIGTLALSGGQKQRIAIARAIVKNPKILLLDEATSALDTKSEGLVQAALDRAAEGRTTIVIAHRLSTIKGAHNIVVMMGGKIAEQGTHGQLLAKAGVYASLVQAQSIKESGEHEHDPLEKELGFSKELGTMWFEDDDDFEHYIADSLYSPLTLWRRQSSGTVPTLAAVARRRRFSLWTLIRFIASFNKPEKYIMSLGLVLSIFAGCVQPAQSVLLAKAVNSISIPISESDRLRHETNFWASMFLMTGLVTIFLFGSQGMLFAFSAERLIHRARSATFRVLLGQDISFFDEESNTTGTLTTILASDIKNLAGISGATLGTLLIVTVNLFGSLTVAMALGWKLALVCSSAVPLLLLSGFLRTWILARFQARGRTVYQKSASEVSEAITAIRTVVSLTMEQVILDSYKTQLQKQVRDDIPSILRSSYLYACSEALQFFCMALGFWYGGMLLGKHEYSIFQFYVCFSEVIFGAQAAGSVFSYAPGMSKAKHAAGELKALFARRPKIHGRTGGEVVSSIRGMIEFRNVFFRYPTRIQIPVLQGLSFSIRPGQFVAFVGASGCGKSTTIALLERFYEPLAGGIYVDGRDITGLEMGSYRRRLAFVGQEPALFQGSIRENILLGMEDGEVSEEQVVAACKDANIYDFVISLPQGFNTEVGSKGGMLSGGQKQRIAIARALLRDPRILLLDEATSALDSESESIVQTALDTAARGRTTLAVAHRLSTIQRADVIYVLANGRIAESGTHGELLRRRGHYYDLVNLQSLA
ncbi:P-loop containing nucleoside triphosphate hydrolase protein [Aspergillus karnatakaensis]|uniref:P-loop containing nucleoside triphosphate hydrolase protein n=1 Tax=Aspergillus karnatakaensis TaxID=1810916 RepID=UPI003CCDF21C